MNKLIWDLQLHEELEINDSLRVIRVPAGWLYLVAAQHPVFVPMALKGQAAEIAQIEKRYQDDAIKKIIDAVLTYYEIEESDLYSRLRKRNIVNARYQVIYFVTKYAKKMTLEKRGAIFGLGHDTVIHALKKVNTQIELYPAYRRQVIDISRLIDDLMVDLYIKQTKETKENESTTENI